MRATGHAVCSSFQRIGGFAAPFLVNSPASLVVVALLLGAGNWMAAVCSYTLPETKGSLLTNMYYLYKCVVYLSVFECRCAYMCVCVAAASIFIHLCTQTHSLTHFLFTVLQTLDWIHLRRAAWAVSVVVKDGVRAMSARNHFLVVQADEWVSVI
jgi:hypothetical protein